MIVVDTIMSNLRFKIIIFGIIFTFILVSSTAILYMEGAFANNLETRTYSGNAGNLGGEPIQTSYSGKTFTISDIYETYTIIPVANYEISAKVVSTANYNHDKLGISPVDLCVVWGKIVNDSNIVYSQGGRICSYRYTGTVSDDITSHMSNNHIIPANDSIANAIKSIKTNDVVTIKGYLVDVTKTYIVGDGKWMWKTSQTRYDTRDGSCEIIYVTSVS